MATLVGRKVWHGGAALRCGIVRSQRFDPDISMVEIDGESALVPLPSVCLLLTPEAAIEHCEEAENYWRRKRIDLEERD